MISLSAVGQESFVIANQVASQLQQDLLRNIQTVTLAPGGIQEFPLSLSPVGFDGIGVGLPSTGGTVSLRLPSGVVVEQANAIGAGFGWEFGPESVNSDTMPGCPPMMRWLIIRLPAGQPAGTYTVRISGVSQRGQACITFASAGVGPVDPAVGRIETVGDGARTDRKSYRVGDVVTISLPVREAILAQNARVEGVVFDRKRGEAGRVVLLDPDRDGVYSGVFRPVDAGEYVVLVMVPGKSRRESALFSVSP